MSSNCPGLLDVELNNQFFSLSKINPKTRRSRSLRGSTEMATLEMDTKMVDTVHNLTLPPEIEAEFNNLDNKIGCEEPKLSKEDPQETRHLKELLLLHLDWIQQQQEALLSKDRQIQRLKQEKEALKCRLERMDRRMSLLRQKKDTSPPPPPRDQLLIEKAKTAPVTTNNGRGEGQGRGTKRKHSLEPQNLSEKFDSANDIKTKQDSGNKCISTDSENGNSSPRKSKSRSASAKHISPFKQSYLYSQQPPRKCRSQSIIETDELFFEDEIETETKPVDSDSDDEVQIMDHSHRRRESTANGVKAEKDGIHRTDVLYYVPVTTVLPSWEISPVKERQEEVKVPTFRIKPVPTGYQLEGTENLTDEIFLKRHQKPEADEKRRKRWDAQMLREQKMLERLQNRDRHSHLRAKADGNNSLKRLEEEDIESFLPFPDNAKFLEISEEVPVSAFGYSLPDLRQTVFNLPWFTFEKHHKEDKNRLSLNRMRRK